MKKKMTGYVQARVSHILKQKLARYCERNNESEADVIRLLLEKFLLK